VRLDAARSGLNRSGPTSAERMEDSVGVVVVGALLVMGCIVVLTAAAGSSATSRLALAAMLSAALLGSALLLWRASRGERLKYAISTLSVTLALAAFLLFILS